MTPLSSTARDRRLAAGLVRRAIETRAPLLAEALEHYAAAEGLTWEELAKALGGSTDGLHQVALCRPPRPERFAEDARAIAGGWVDSERLLSLLRQFQVLEELTAFPAAPATPYSGHAPGCARPRGGG
jgi:hypothetical protein